jgi:predicted ATP-grasp superfamily ATP-dependent carboligase
MRLFIYEFVAGGGWWSVDPHHPPSGSLLNEGSAMLQSLIRDFASVATICTLRDIRCDIDVGSAQVMVVTSAADEPELFADCVHRSDWVLVIAPEFDGHLSTRCKWVEQLGGRLLGPGSEFVALASDKELTARTLSQSGIRVPRGGVVSQRAIPSLDFRFPAVLKPRDGAGSIEVQLVEDWDQVQRAMGPFREYRLEEFCEGIPASISVLAGPRRSVLLPASRQRLSNDNRFRYLGGEVPIAPPLCLRAQWLANRVIAALPPTIGYWGLDLVLGNTDDGSGDVVIEVNPRLTTSYLGLRRIARANLAAGILDIATGLPCELSFDSQPVQFDSSTWSLLSETRTPA